MYNKKNTEIHNTIVTNLSYMIQAAIIGIVWNGNMYNAKHVACMLCVHSQGCSEAMLYNIGGHYQKHLGFVTHLILNLFMVVAVRTYLLLQKKIIS